MARSKKPQPEADPEIARAHQLLNRGDTAGAAGAFSRIIQRRPRDADAYHGLGLAASRLGRSNEAAAAITKAIQLDGRRAIYHHDLGTVLQDLGRLEPAVEAFTRAGWLDRTNAESHADAAGALERLGRIDEANAAIARALQANPGHERARVIRAKIELRAGSPDRARLAALRDELAPLTTGAATPLAQSLAWEAFGDASDRLGDAATAFHAFTEVNHLERSRQPCPSDQDREVYLKSIDAFAGSFTRERAERWAAERPDDGVPAPALLVGFPRSGTTMTERALDAHAGVESIEEKPTFADLRQEFGRLLGAEAAGRATFDEAMDHATPEQISHLRRAYWDIVERHRGGRVPPGVVLLDKLPLMITALTWVNRVFPDARVIVALRDPRDVCLSCLRQRFVLNPPMSFFLDPHDTARLYERAMGSWLRTRDMYTLAWSEIRYEDVVADFEARMRELVAFLGLGWDDAVLGFHERTGGKASMTPSYHAVRKKVSATAVGRHLRYADQLAPILPTLQPFIDAFGYGAGPGPAE
jgi:tetratricopeptide (TPR) repeat protein